MEIDRTSRRRRFTTGGLLLGLGLGGFFDGIVLHQILQWHHMVSSLDDYPMTTLAGLEANTLADGLFHAVTYLLTVTGIAFLWSALRRATGIWSTGAFLGLLLLGWGFFNILDGIVNHHLLEVHHIREDTGNQLAWDIAFLTLGVAQTVTGLLITRAHRLSVNEIEYQSMTFTDEKPQAS